MCHQTPFDMPFIVAFTNTLVVSVVGVALATILGIVIGVARISGNWLVSKAALVYIEFFRNVPLLVQLFFWFYIVVELPKWQDSYHVGDWLYLNNRYLAIPWLSPGGTGVALVWLVVADGGSGNSHCNLSLAGPAGRANGVDFLSRAERRCHNRADWGRELGNRERGQRQASPSALRSQPLRNPSEKWTEGSRYRAD